MPSPKPPQTLRPIPVTGSTNPTEMEDFNFGLVLFLITIESHDDTEFI